MAVNISTIISVCLYCKTSSEVDAGKEFHDIFDEVGLELQLPTLVEKFFHHKVVNPSKHLLCDDCVNRLIELYDVEEHAKGLKEVEEAIIQKSAEKVNNVSGISAENCFKIAANDENFIKIENSLANDPEIEILKSSERIEYDTDTETYIPETKKLKACQEIHCADQEIDLTKGIEGVEYDDHESYTPNNSENVSQHNDVSEIELSKDYEEIDYNLTRDNSSNADCHEIGASKFMTDDNHESNFPNHSEEVSQLYADQEIDIPEDNEEMECDLSEDDQNNDEDIHQKIIIEDGQYDNDHESQISKQTDVLEQHEDKKLLQKKVIKDFQHNRKIQMEDVPQYIEDQEIKLPKEVVYELSSDYDRDSKFKLVEMIADNDSIKGTETPCGESEIINENQIEESGDEVVASKTPGTVYICSAQNDLIEEHVYDDDKESLLECQSLNSVNELYDEVVLEDDQELIETEDDNFEEVDFKFKELKSRQDKELNEETKYLQKYSIIEIDETIDSIIQETQISQQDAYVTEVLVDYNTQDDTMSTEEEYLIEEITCSQEFDCVDLNEYLDNAIITQFEKLELQWSVECNLCLEKYETLQDLLKHSCISEFIEDGQQSCIIKDCQEFVNNFKSLARHLIIQHYDKLESLPIYGRCADCEKNFSNFIEFNKHSCCRSIKRKAGARNFCQYCNMNFASLKRYVFHMQFHLTKHRPKVCLLCGALFKNSNDFFEHTQYYHKPETAMACVKCDRFFKDLDVYESHMELHDESKYNFVCKYCPKKYTKKSGLTVHMNVYHNYKNKPLECEYCEKKFATNSSYRNHMKSHIPEVQVPAFVCSECGLISYSSDIMKDHIEMDKESPCYSAKIIEEILSAGYTCENCSIDFLSQKHLQKHRLSSNHSNKQFYCFICRKAYKTLKHMRNHTVNHKDYEQWQDMFPITRFYMCDIGQCQECFSVWTSLYYHKKKPHKAANATTIDSTTDFKCQFCQQLCSSKMSLAVHVARTHNSNNLRCSHCKQSYKNDNLLQEHIEKFHTAVKCSVCFKDFKNRRNLASHEQLVHVNEKRYFCRYCKKGYFYKTQMEAHEKNVHAEISYKCDICHFITNYPKSLEIHMAKHNNQLGFKCTICPKAFGRKQPLTDHMKIHQDTKEYVCRDYYELGCNASFVTHSNMKTHILKKHPNSKNDTEKVTLQRKRSTRKCLVSWVVVKGLSNVNISIRKAVETKVNRN